MRSNPDTQRAALYSAKYLSYEAIIVFVTFFGMVFVLKLLSISSLLAVVFSGGAGFSDALPFLLFDLSLFFFFAAGAILAFALWDLHYFLKLGQRTDLNENDESDMRRCLVNNPILSDLLNRHKIKCIYGDFSVSAHIRGVFNNNIVVTEGLLVLLLRRDRDSLCIVSHEAAHVLGKDRRGIGLLSMGFFNSFLAVTISPFFSQAPLGAILYNSGILILMVYFARRREIAADFVAGLIFGDLHEYRERLGRFADKGWSVFHPSLKRRMQALEPPSAATRESAFLYLYVLLIFTLSVWVGFRPYLLGESLIIIVILVVGVTYELMKRHLRKQLIANFGLNI